MVVERIQIPKRTGEILHGDLFIPDSEMDSTPQTLVILCHGFTGDRQEWGRFTQLCETLADNGYHAITFDFSGSGENALELITLSKQVADLEDVALWGRKHNFSNFVTIGLSFGGLTSLLASIPDRITAIFWAPAFNMKRIVENKLKSIRRLEKWHLQSRKKIFKLSQSQSHREPLLIDVKFYEQIEKVEVEPILNNFTTPSLIIQGTKDGTVLPAWINENISQMPQNGLHNLILIEGAGHGFDGTHLKQAISNTLEWITKIATGSQ